MAKEDILVKISRILAQEGQISSEELLRIMEVLQKK